MRCLYREVICRAGDYVDIDVYPVFGKAKTRKAKYRPTSDQQERINRRNAKLKLTRLLNANFTAADILVHLTYRQECLPGNDEETVKTMRNFFRRLKRRMKAAGAELRYVCVTERSSTGRYHHHLIVNGGVSAREIADCWKYGIVQVSPLEFDYDDGISCLAQYLSKGMTAGYKSFSYSRNLKNRNSRRERENCRRKRSRSCSSLRTVLRNSRSYTRSTNTVRRKESGTRRTNIFICE